VEMNRAWKIVIVVIASIIFGVIGGYIMRGPSEPLNKAMAWGFEEKSNVWNRIRVNESGFVICAKEGIKNEERDK